MVVPLKRNTHPEFLVVLPTDYAGKTIRADDIRYCTPLVAVPQSTSAITHAP